MPENLNRVAIIGCGNINAKNVYSLLMNGAAERLLLVGDDGGRLPSEITYLENAIPLARAVRIDTGGGADAAEADIVIIASGTEAAAGDTPIETITRNAAAVREICENLKIGGFKGMILVTTNPVDILARVALEASGLPPNKVIGSGNSLAATELRAAASGKVKAGRGDLPEISTWCAALNGNPPLIEFCQPNCPDFGTMLEAVEKAAAEPEPNKDFAYRPAGTCVNRICEAVLRDERTVLPVYVLSAGQYGISDVYLNLPCVIGKNGVEQILEPPLKNIERDALSGLGENLKKIYEQTKTANKTGTAGSL